MDQGTLVEMQIEHGQRLIDRLTKEGVDVKAAAWVKESDTGDWYLYLATPLVSEDGATRSAYRRVNTIISQLQEDGFWIDPLEIKAIGPTDPVAKAVLAARDRYAGRVGTHIPGERLGPLATEEAYLYPPTSAA
jgi:hypothetical protein